MKSEPKLNHLDSIQLLSDDRIENLLAESGVPCVSILMPMHRLSPDRQVDRESLKKSVAQAKELLREKYASTDFDLGALSGRIDELVETVDYVHSKDGIGIYVSPRISQIVQFPFPVSKKVKAGLFFDTRDLLYYQENIADYLVLAISKKHIHLYRGKGEELSEINDDNFPINYLEAYEYAKPGRSNSFSSNVSKDFEKDKSIMQEIRLTDFLRQADSALEKYMHNHLMLIISGGKKEMADYLKITAYKKKIAGKITGNYGFNGDTQLATLSWQSMNDYLNSKKEEAIQGLYELIGKKKIAIGLEEVWEAATSGNGLELFVEKDFEYHAFLINEKSTLRLTKPGNNQKCVFVNDSVERILRMVRGKKGKITFTKNGSMSNFNGIALQLRYVPNKSI